MIKQVENKVQGSIIFLYLYALNFVLAREAQNLSLAEK